MAVEYKQSGLNFKKMLSQFWTANSVKYEHVIILVPSNAIRSTWNSGKGIQRSENKAFFSLFTEIYTKQKSNSDLENLISFSVIYRFIGL